MPRFTHQINKLFKSVLLNKFLIINLKLQTSLPDFKFKPFTDSIFRNQLKQQLKK